MIVEESHIEDFKTSEQYQRMLMRLDNNEQHQHKNEDETMKILEATQKIQSEMRRRMMSSTNPME